MLVSRNEESNKHKYLRNGILCLIAWVYVAYHIFNELKDKDGIIYIVSSTREGNYNSIFLVTLSVVLFAYALRNIVFYFKPDIKT